MSSVQVSAEGQFGTSSSTPEGEPARTRNGKTPVSRAFLIRSLITAVFAAGALFFGIADFLRAVNPKILVSISPSIYLMPSMIFPLLFGDIALFVGLTDPQITLRYLREYWLARVGIIAAALGLILSITSGFLAMSYPNGVISDDNDYRIPLANTAQVENTVERVAGECTSGWATLTTISYHGVEYVNTCQTNHAAIIVFGNAADAELGMDGMQKAALKHIYGLNTAAENAKVTAGGYSALNGSRWSIIGPSKPINELQDSWGGDIVSLNSNLKALLK